MTQIYRLETKQGYGPFTGIVNNVEFAHQVGWLQPIEGGVQRKDENDETHPHHLIDCLSNEIGPADLMFARLFGCSPEVLPGKWAVGCNSKEEFLNWFPAKSLEWFKEQGMLLSIYEVDDKYIKAGKYQVMFRKDKAKLVKQEAPVELIQEEAK